MMKNYKKISKLLTRLIFIVTLLLLSGGLSLLHSQTLNVAQDKLDFSNDSIDTLSMAYQRIETIWITDERPGSLILNWLEPDKASINCKIQRWEFRNLKDAYVSVFERNVASTNSVFSYADTSVNLAFHYHYKISFIHEHDYYTSKAVCAAPLPIINKINHYNTDQIIYVNLKNDSIFVSHR